MKWHPYSAYRASGIAWLGELPNHWDVRTLKRLSSVELSNVDKHTVAGERSVRLCNYVDVYNNERITTALPFMQASASDEQIRRLTLRRGDVVITKDSETPDDIGVPALVVEDIPDLVCGYHLARVRPKLTAATGEYLQRAFLSTYVRAEFCCAAVGMTRFGLGRYDIENLKVPAPTIEEQHGIAKMLDCETIKIDALLAKQQRLIELLEEKKQAMISHAVTKGLDPKAPMKGSGVAWLGNVPAHWSVCALGLVATVDTGSTPPRERPDYWGGDIPWIKTGEIDYLPILSSEEHITEAALRETAVRLGL